MSLIADGLLIATCLAATVYCFVLGRRLKQFSNTEVGVGQQIVQLNKTLEETRAALRESQAGAKAEAETLAREVVAARKLVSQLRSYEGLSKRSEASDAPAAEPASTEPPAAERQVFKAATAVALDADAEPEDNTQQAAPSEEDTAGQDEDVDIAEIDVNAMLAASAGEQQLGFLPDDDIGDDQSDESEPGVEAQADEQEDTPDDSEEDAETPVPEGLAEAGAQDKAGNLLKVERMAL